MSLGQPLFWNKYATLTLYLLESSDKKINRRQRVNGIYIIIYIFNIPRRMLREVALYILGPWGEKT